MSFSIKKTEVPHREKSYKVIQILKIPNYTFIIELNVFKQKHIYFVNKVEVFLMKSFVLVCVQWKIKRNTNILFLNLPQGKLLEAL